MSMPPTMRLLVIFANNRSPDIGIVDVPSHHCALPQPKTAIRRHLRTRSTRGRGNAQTHTKTKIRKFLLRGLWPFIRNFAPTKISLYTVCVHKLQAPPPGTQRTQTASPAPWYPTDTNCELRPLVPNGHKLQAPPPGTQLT